ncbi:type II toxin-antitoxin system PemK/MazF family toxin [Candidatus Saccharibacteria bacterium]|uniref:type II toxin-antitoxin system PemK/MazF family toxin n=1 Tax=Candidatus Nanoperiomorbus periodonticus TaxID=2171989 RepID=UPI00101C38ED|nr:type II toxin-antitoxin system PemK/MazF family toxin [Candidatus Saccharibacteria bacterium]
MVMVRQGSIIKINLDPKAGHEQRGYRPYICLSHSIVTKYSNIAIFAPISNTGRNYPFYVPLDGTASTGKVLLDQLVTIDYNARNYRYVEDIPDDLLEKLLARVKVLFEKG